MKHDLKLLVDAFKLAPKAAVDFFRRKGYAYSWDYTDTWGPAHARAFTVAKAMRLDILQAIRGELQRGLDEGISFQEFQNQLIPRLKAMGWWGKVPDPQDSTRMVQLGSPYRLKTIFETNMQSAYQAGHWKQAQDLRKRAPQIQYIAVLDNRTRPAHSALHGKVFSIDDPAWKVIAPPNGYGCRCTFVTITAGEMSREGLRVEPPSEGIDKEELVSRKSGLMRTVKGVRLKSGAEFYPDPGFDHNASESAWQPDLESYDHDVARQYVAGAVTGPDFERFFKGEVNGKFPVAVLSPAYRELIGAKSQTVLLSEQTRDKNVKHPEIGLEEWHGLQHVIEDAQLVMKQEDGTTLSFTTFRGKLYLAAVKATRDGGELYVTSFRRSSPKQVKRERKNGTVVRDDLGY